MANQSRYEMLHSQRKGTGKAKGKGKAPYQRGYTFDQPPSAKDIQESPTDALRIFDGVEADDDGELLTRNQSVHFMEAMSELEGLGMGDADIGEKKKKKKKKKKDDDDDWDFFSSLIQAVYGEEDEKPKKRTHDQKKHRARSEDRPSRRLERSEEERGYGHSRRSLANTQVLRPRLNGGSQIYSTEPIKDKSNPMGKPRIAQLDDVNWESGFGDYEKNSFDMSDTIDGEGSASHEVFTASKKLLSPQYHAGKGISPKGGIEIGKIPRELSPRADARHPPRRNSLARVGKHNALRPSPGHSSAGSFETSSFDTVNTHKSKRTKDKKAKAKADVDDDADWGVYIYNSFAAAVLGEPETTPRRKAHSPAPHTSSAKYDPWGDSDSDSASSDGEFRKVHVQTKQRCSSSPYDANPRCASSPPGVKITTPSGKGNAARVQLHHPGPQCQGKAVGKGAVKGKGKGVVKPHRPASPAAKPMGANAPPAPKYFF